MTAEIALINKLAVTLAADSAVTISSSDGSKVYNSADKIFEATNFDPIGVMVYNNPELSGITLATFIVVMGRHLLAKASKKTARGKPDMSHISFDQDRSNEKSTRQLPSSKESVKRSVERVRVELERVFTRASDGR